MKNKCSVAIIGVGQFGKLITNVLKNQPDLNIFVISSRKINIKNVTQIKHADLQKMDVVIPCVPIKHFESEIKKMASHLKPHSLVIDVCSVKVFPVTVMKKRLSKDIQIIASHPLFGPHSFKENQGLEGLKIVLHPTRVNKKTFARVKKLCQELKLKVIELSPQEHDKNMAHSQAFSMLVGRLSKSLGVKPTPIDTLGTTFLLKNNEIVKDDIDHLIFDILKFNPYCKQMLSNLLTETQSVIKKLS